ncbi:methyltransferase domain-containing protein [Pedobacter sp. HMF7647]|uniref:Methyltransferase domain-containing protein n=1 Tax=Hufsiella arboris TaxID=2695275 RepID=A0A7K1YAP9_9SPHI|nr:class I SAM-dependent methyltransferase [Hufsiella arboris]MXV51656.1 methyltransferase domain-containing protein [Hufsiella arboris]
MNNELTDLTFWKEYWESKKGLAFKVPENYTFHKQLKQIVKDDNIKSAIEIGGFPGYYAIYLKKYLSVDTSLLDYYIHPEIVKEVLEVNGLRRNDIDVIEADLFSAVPERQFDLVLSCGLIEHFEDTTDIISRHLKYLKPGGTLFITLPNFLGVNGWVQRTFDKENYQRHNVEAMDISNLVQAAVSLRLHDIDIYYHGGFSIWLENWREKSLLTKAFIKALWLAGKIPTKMFRFESLELSPYIVMTAKKPI